MMTPSRAAHQKSTESADPDRKSLKSLDCRLAINLDFVAPDLDFVAPGFDFVACGL
jgi:hypothetical protein